MKYLVSLTICMVFASYSNAQPEIYLSFSNLGEGNALSNDVANFSVGQSGSAFIWIDEDVAANGLVGLNVFASGSNDLEINSVEVFNPDVLITVGEEQIELGSRWSSVAENVFATSGANMIGFGGGIGIQPQFGTELFVDPFHDPSSSAFLFGRVDFVVLQEGPIELFLDDTNFINSGVETFPKTGAVTISTAIPEPSTAILAAIVLSTVSTSRQRARKMID